VYKLEHKHIDAALPKGAEVASLVLQDGALSLSIGMLAEPAVGEKELRNANWRTQQSHKCSPLWCVKFAVS